jgi:DNA helicase II / ATP-dependent DNA helicase PcrA
MGASLSVIDEIKQCITSQKSFVLQGGAGSGKTETLKEMIEFVSYNYADKKIDCITHTNKAVAEIQSRVDSKHVIRTIHSFLNELTKNYQKNIHQVIETLFLVIPVHRQEVDDYKDEKEFKTKEHDKYKRTYAKFASAHYMVLGSRVADKPVGKKVYDTDPLGFNNKLNEDILNLNSKIREEIDKKNFRLIEYNETRFNDFESLTYGHDGLLEISFLLFEKYSNLRSILRDKFDFIFIDEYQDTNPKIINLFLEKLNPNKKLTVGLFGDSMQAIYGDGVGNVESYISNGTLIRINKEDNYRCSRDVIKFINTLRVDSLQQEIALKFIDGVKESIESRKGQVDFYYALVDSKAHSRSPQSEKDSYSILLEKLIKKAAFLETSKILLLSNKAISERAGFANLYRIFSDRYIDPREEFTRIFTTLQLVDLAEICNAYVHKNYNLILSKLKSSGLVIQKLANKIQIATNIEAIINSDKSLAQTLDLAFSFGLLKKSDSFKAFIDRAKAYIQDFKTDADLLKFEQDFTNGANTYLRMQEKQPSLDEETFDENKGILKRKDFFLALLSDDLKFQEVLNYFKYEDEQTPYITMHKTKGTGIDNVLVVLDEYFWTEYDFASAFDQQDLQSEKRKKNLQLIYVACSRAKSNLRCVRLLTADEEAIFLNAFQGFNIQKILL